jgi:hypothetical protein
MELAPGDDALARAMSPALPISSTLPGAAVRGLTPELSRAAKRRRLGRIVSCQRDALKPQERTRAKWLWDRT